MSKIEIITGNIVDDKLLEKADAVVNASNPWMRYGSGVCGAIFDKAGREQLENYTRETFCITDEYNQPNMMKTAEVRITPGFNLPCDIIFAKGPRRWDYRNYEEAETLLLKTYANIMAAAKERGYHYILVPAMGTGHYGFTHEQTAEKVITCLGRLADENQVNIIFVLSDEGVADIYRKYL